MVVVVLVGLVLVELLIVLAVLLFQLVELQILLAVFVEQIPAVFEKLLAHLLPVYQIVRME